LKGAAYAAPFLPGYILGRFAYAVAVCSVGGAGGFGAAGGTAGVLPFPKAKM